MPPLNQTCEVNRVISSKLYDIIALIGKNRTFSKQYDKTGTVTRTLIGTKVDGVGPETVTSESIDRPMPLLTDKQSPDLTTDVPVSRREWRPDFIPRLYTNKIH
jgi:hypothetical protein